jgi:hypothetical protein
MEMRFRQAGNAGSLAILDVHMEHDEHSLGEDGRPVLAGSDGARQDQNEPY